MLTNFPHWHLLLGLCPLEFSSYNIAFNDLIKLGHVKSFGHKPDRPAYNTIDKPSKMINETRVKDGRGIDACVYL